MSKKPKLPKYVFARGQRLWIRIKDETGTWRNSPTPYTINQVEQVKKFVVAKLRAVEAFRKNDGRIGTRLSTYAERWLKERAARDVSSVGDERNHLFNHALRLLGDVMMEDVRPKDVRDMVLDLQSPAKNKRVLASKSINHIFRTLHSVFESAMVDELILTNPVVVKPGVLPKIVDADPEWRPRATFTVTEVQRLLSCTVVPPERRVLYALKALAGLRHGEAAALMWSHIDDRAEPLYRLNIVRAYSTRHDKLKRTKTEVSRFVPMHSTLVALLEVWRAKWWPIIYGRTPTKDDLIVPTRAMTPYSASDSVHAMKRDMLAAGLSIAAGERRDRGGHDLRSWYRTRLIEDGADSMIIDRFTHAPAKDVKARYERYSWATYCREASKMKFELDGAPLEFVTDPLQAANIAKRWRKNATPTGFEPEKSNDKGSLTSIDKRDPRRLGAGREGLSAVLRARPRRPWERRVTRLSTAARMIRRAVTEGDLPRILGIADDLETLDE